MNINILKYNDIRLNYGRKAIKQFAKRISFANVLDIGAGNGDDLEAIEKINPKARFMAIETYPSLIEILTDKMNIECFPVDLEKNSIPLEDNSVDLIIANQILEHTKEIFWIFHEICRTLRPGKFVIIGVPNLASLHNRIMLLLGKQPSCINLESAHVRGYTKEGLERYAKIGGLKLVAFKGSNFYPFPPKIANFLSSLFPKFSVGIFFLFKKVRDYDNKYLDFPIKNNLATNYFLGKKQ